MQLCHPSAAFPAAPFFPGPHTKSGIRAFRFDGCNSQLVSQRGRRVGHCHSALLTLDAGRGWGRGPSHRSDCKGVWALAGLLPVLTVWKQGNTNAEMTQNTVAAFGAEATAALLPFRAQRQRRYRRSGCIAAAAKTGLA